MRSVGGSCALAWPIKVLEVSQIIRGFSKNKMKIKNRNTPSWFLGMMKLLGNHEMDLGARENAQEDIGDEGGG